MFWRTCMTTGLESFLWSRKSINKHLSWISLTRGSNLRLIYQRQPSFASITMFGWKTTQFGEYSSQLMCAGSTNIWLPVARGKHRVKGLMGRRLATGWWYITNPSNSPARLISNSIDVFEAWWCTTIRLSTTFTAKRPLISSLNIWLFFAVNIFCIV